MITPPARRSIFAAFGFKVIIRAPGVARRPRRHLSLPEWCVWARMTSASIF